MKESFVDQLVHNGLSPEKTFNDLLVCLAILTARLGGKVVIKRSEFLESRNSICIATGNEEITLTVEVDKNAEGARLQ